MLTYSNWLCAVSGLEFRAINDFRIRNSQVETRAKPSYNSPAVSNGHLAPQEKIKTPDSRISLMCDVRAGHEMS